MFNNNHGRQIVNGISIDTLNNMEYKEPAYLQYVHPIRCNYIMPSDIKSCKQNQLSIINANIRTMKLNYANFSAELLNTEPTFDIIGFCETHLTDTNEKLYMRKNYNYYGSNISNNKGGVCLFISNRFESKIRRDLCIKTEHLETVVAECRVDTGLLTVCVVYHRPGTSQPLFENDLTNILDKINTRCMLLGDFNVNILNEETDNNVRNFVSCLREYAYRPIITKPTRVQNGSITLIDHMWVNFEQNHDYRSNIVLSNVTDHFPTVFNYELQNARKFDKLITFRREGDASDAQFKDKLRNCDLDEILLMDDVNLAFNAFHDKIFKIYDESYPLISKRITLNSNKNPWITSAIKESIKTKNRMYKKYVKHPITYADTYKLYRNNLTKIIRTAKNDYYKQKFTRSNGNMKETWKQLNNMLGKDHSNKNSEFKVGNRIIKDETEIADAFNDFYANVGHNTAQNLPHPNVTFENYLPRRDFPRLELTHTTTMEIKSIIGRSKSCSAGPDAIPMKVIKNNSDILSPIISHLCNLSITTGIFPEMHKIGHITPLYKSKERDNIQNYRPICILNSVSKILEKAIAVRLISHLEGNNILIGNQYAYRRGRGTDLALTNFTKDIIQNFDDGKLTIAVFLDLSRAFDCVNHQILKRKLEHYGVSQTALNWFSSYLRGRKHRVKYNGKLSTEKSINIGVPQLSKENSNNRIYSAAIAIKQVRFFAIYKMSFTISYQGIYGRFLV